MKDKYSVKPIDSFQCKEWCLKKHYAKRLPPIQHAFGLFDTENILVGIVTYGTPVSSTLRDLRNNKELSKKYIIKDKRIEGRQKEYWIEKITY